MVPYLPYVGMRMLFVFAALHATPNPAQRLIAGGDGSEEGQGVRQKTEERLCCDIVCGRLTTRLKAFEARRLSALYS